MKLNLFSILYLKKYSFLFIFSVVLLFYFNTLNNGYAIDDEVVIQNNQWVKSGFKGIMDIFTHHYDTGGNQGYEYRPITLLTFAIEYDFFGENPFVSHLISLLLFTLIIHQLVYLFRQIQWREQTLLVVTVLLFVAHPIHTEVINNIKSRDELLSIFFGLLSIRFVLFFVDKKKWKYLFFAFLFIVIASLSKISAVIFVGITPLILYFFRPTNWKNIVSIPLLLFIGSLVYALLSSFIIAEQNTSLIRPFEFYENPLINAPFTDRIPAAIYLFGFQSLLLLFPYPLSFYYGYDAVKIATWEDWQTYLALIYIIVLVIISIKGFLEKKQYSFLLLFFGITIFPYTNFLVLSPGIIAERFLFLASIPLSMGVAWLITRFKSRYFVIIFTSFLIFVSLGWTWERNSHWKNTFTLVEHDIKHLNNSFKAHIYYATKLIEQEEKENYPSQQKFQKAADLYAKAIDIYPYSSVTYNNLGVVHLVHLKQPQVAKPFFTTSIELDSSNYDAVLNLAATYKYLNEKDMVFNIMDPLLLNAPEFKKGYTPYINYLIELRAFSKALELTNQAIQNFPNEGIFYRLKGDIFGYQRNIDKALENYEKYYSIEPTDEMKEHIQYLKSKMQSLKK